MPAISLAEPFQKPSTMLYRNLLSMEVEELIRSYPVDGAVLMGGCDKTTPGLVMGAISAGVPAIFLPAGPMLRGDANGRALASGTSVWRMWADYRAGLILSDDLDAVEQGVARSPGALHDDGHRLDDDGSNGSPWAGVARLVISTSRRLSFPNGFSGRQTCSSKSRTRD